MRSRLFDGLHWVMAANFFSLLGSLLLTVGLPRFLTPFEFGLWQVYQMYALYLGYATLGYTDGLNLRLAGRRFEELSPRLIRPGWLLLTLIDAVLFGGLVAAVALFSAAEVTLFAWAALGALFYISRSVLGVVLQSTLQARAFAASILVERFVTVLVVAVLVAFGHRDAEILVIGDVIGKFLGLLVSVVAARRVAFTGPVFDRRGVAFFWRDCWAGLNVLLANVSALTIQGGIRAMIGFRWGVVTFGQVSLAFQLASFVMVLINSLAMSLLPNIRRVDPTTYATVYSVLRRRSMRLLVPCLALSYPLSWMLEAWAPDYREAAFFVRLLFPLSIFEFLNRGLTAVFLKALRLERKLLLINFASLALTLFCGGVSIFILDSVELAAVSIIVGLMARSWLSERALSRSLEGRIDSGPVLEFLVVSVYLACVNLSSDSLGLVLVLVAAVGYQLAVRLRFSGSSQSRA